MLRSVEIEGSGMAAQACAALLRRFGWDVNVPGLGKPAVQYLVINSLTKGLFEEIFEIPAPSIYEISRRLVGHYHISEITSVKEPAFVIATNLLERLPAFGKIRERWGPAAWRIFAGALPPEGVLISPGTRKGWIFEGHCRAEEYCRSAIFESLPEGWLFWAPVSPSAGFIQMVVPFSPEDPAKLCHDLAKHARLIHGKNIAIGNLLAGPFHCSAAIHSRLAGDNWIASGTSALRFDPVSGDGTGTSLRSAILACAALRATAQFPPELCLQYYRTRLHAAFQKHLQSCEALYQQAGLAELCEEESRYLRQTDHQEKPVAGPAFRLENYTLVAT